MEEIMTWDEFKVSVDREVARRLKLFKKWTACVPQKGAVSHNTEYRRHLSFCTNTRNRSKDVVEHQGLSEIDSDTDYNNWACGVGIDNEEINEDPRANPDVLTAPAIPVAAFEPEDYALAKEIRARLHLTLSAQQIQIYKLYEQQLGFEKIGSALGISRQSVENQFKRIQEKLIKMYETFKNREHLRRIRNGALQSNN